MECCAGQKERLSPEEVQRRQDMPYYGIKVKDFTHGEADDSSEKIPEVQVKGWMTALDVKKALRTAGITNLPSRHEHTVLELCTVIITLSQ